VLNQARKKFFGGPMGVVRAFGVLAALVAVAAVPVAGQAASSPAKATTITVSAGKPSELAFKLSKISQLPAGTVTFNVTNAGKIAHNFEICLVPATTAPNACVGKSKKTAFLQPGKSANLTVTLSQSGTYEYLCTFPGHSAAGMKGLVGVGVTVTAAQVAKAIKAAAAATTTTTSGATTTTASGGGGATTTTASGGGGGAVVGDGCPAGTTIQTSGNTDNDTDEAGQPTDGDGCI